MGNQEIMPISKFTDRQEISISYRGSLAKEASAIGCKKTRKRLIKQLISNEFANCICYWETPETLVVGLIEDIGLFYPHW